VGGLVGLGVRGPVEAFVIEYAGVWVALWVWGCGALWRAKSSLWKCLCLVCSFASMSNLPVGAPINGPVPLACSEVRAQDGWRGVAQGLVPLCW